MHMYHKYFKRIHFGVYIQSLLMLRELPLLIDMLESDLERARLGVGLGDAWSR